jgi:hypothetical protein
MLVPPPVTSKPFPTTVDEPVPAGLPMLVASYVAAVNWAWLFGKTGFAAAAWSVTPFTVTV